MFHFLFCFNQFSPTKHQNTLLFNRKSVMHLSVVLFAKFTLDNLRTQILKSKHLCHSASYLWMHIFVTQSILNFFFLALTCMNLSYMFFFLCLNGFDPVWLCSYILSQGATVMTTLVYNQSKMIMLYILKKVLQVMLKDKTPHRQLLHVSR